MAKKIILVIVIMGLACGSVIYIPKANSAAVVTDPINAGINAVTAGSATSLTVKEYVLDTIARAIARALLSAATSGMIKKIQGGGRDGGPAFVQNWRNYQTDSQYRGENVFRSILAGTRLCNYFSGDVKNLFGANQKVPSAGQNLRVDNFDPFALRANCTLPSNFNMANYQNDFAGNGGWEAWSRLMEPQNNYYGALFGSLDEADKQRGLEESGDLNEALAGSGYTSIRDKNCAGTGAGAKCAFLGKVFTPGDLLGKSAASTIDNDLGWLVSSDEIGEILIDLTTAITSRMINLATSDSSKDYESAPKADSRTNGYLSCINSCPASDNLACQTNCADAWGYRPPQSNYTPPSDSGNGDGNGDGEPSPGGEGPCASQEEIDSFLESNPGDEGRLAEAFPC